VLRALLATRLGFVRATEVAASVGQAFAVLLGIVGFFGVPGLFGPNLFLIFIAIFVYLAASAEGHSVALRAMSRGVPVSTAMMTQYATLTPNADVEDAVQTLLRTSQGEFPVVDPDGKPVGVLARADIIRTLKERGPNAKVADAMTSPVPTLGHRRCLDEAFRILQEKSAPAVAVVDAAGRLVGLVTSETIGEMMLLHQALPKGVSLGPWSRPASS
jgi:stage IV sporulation protein FB